MNESSVAKQCKIAAYDCQQVYWSWRRARYTAILDRASQPQPGKYTGVLANNPQDVDV